jgi:hypothetical protein
MQRQYGLPGDGLDRDEPHVRPPTASQIASASATSVLLRFTQSLTARLTIEALFAPVDDLRARAETIAAKILAWHQGNEASRRLATTLGVGSFTASALVAGVGECRQSR